MSNVRKPGAASEVAATETAGGGGRLGEGRDPGRGALWAGDLVGGGESHAWVEIYLPGAGWVEFDPTNGLMGGTNLIRVAVTRDPAQALPVSGTFIGPTGACLNMAVEVRITACPED